MDVSCIMNKYDQSVYLQPSISLRVLNVNQRPTISVRFAFVGFLYVCTIISYELVKLVIGVSIINGWSLALAVIYLAELNDARMEPVPMYQHLNETCYQICIRKSLQVVLLDV